MSLDQIVNGHQEAYANPTLPRDHLTSEERLELKVLMLERQLIEQKIKGYVEVAIARRGLGDTEYEVNYANGEIRMT